MIYYCIAKQRHYGNLVVQLIITELCILTNFVTGSSSTQGHKKSKKRKRKISCSSIESDSSSDSDDSSSESSSSTDSCSSDDNPAVKKARRRRRKQADKKADMDLKEQFWPREDRPQALKSRKAIAQVSMERFLQMKEQIQKEREKLGLGGEVFSRDSKPKAKKFKKGADDGERELHPARFLPLPHSEPATYWHLVPTTHEHVYRHLPLELTCGRGIPEAVVARMHNRKSAVKLDALAKEVKDVKQAQIAVINYTVIQRFLHPLDLSGMTILLVLTEAGWGQAIGDSDKQRLALIKKFFEDTVEENSGRAVRQQPPLTHEQVKMRWVDTVAAMHPQFSLAAVGQQLAALGAKQAGQKPSSSGNANSGSSGSGQADGKGKSGGDGKPGSRGGPPSGNRTPARFQGLSVCYGYNGKSGCNRIAPGTSAITCKDGTGQNVFAHVCNHFFKDKNTHCLQNHPRFGNH